MIKRGKVREAIFRKEYDHEEADILFGDLPKDLLDTDLIIYRGDEGRYSDCNSWDPYTEIHVIRLRDQTDEEYQDNIDRWAKKNEESRKSRYESYLKLKKEFEEGLITKHGYKMSEEEIAKFEKYSDIRFI